MNRGGGPWRLADRPTASGHFNLPAKSQPSLSMTGPAGASCIVYGDLIGMVTESRKVSAEETLKKLADSWVSRPTDFNSYLNKICGSACIIFYDKQRACLFSTVGSSGFWYQTPVEKRVNIALSEREAYDMSLLSVDSEEFSDLVGSHHLLLRTPFETLVSDVRWCPPGCSLNFESPVASRGGIPSGTPPPAPEIQLHYPSIFGQHPLSYRDFEEQLSHSIESTLSLYFDHYDAVDTRLLFSGGLDSSFLLACLARVLGSELEAIEVVHKAYGVLPSQLQSIVGTFGVGHRLQIEMGAESSDVAIEQLYSGAQQGLGVFTNPQAFRFDGDRRISQEVQPSMTLSGQNADTLYYLDTFSPATQITGKQRIRRTLRSAPLRLAQTGSGLTRGHVVSKFVRAQLARNGGAFGAQQLFLSLMQSGTEHPMPYNQGAAVSLNRRWEVAVHEILQRLGLKLEDVDSLSPDELYRLLRISRFLRTVTNSHANFAVREKVLRTSLKTPFSEGPSLNTFLMGRLRVVDAFNIKRAESRHFKKVAGLSFRSLVERTTRDAQKEPPNELNKEMVRLSGGEGYPFKAGADTLERLFHAAGYPNNSRIDGLWASAQGGGDASIRAEFEGVSAMNYRGPRVKASLMRMARFLNYFIFLNAQK